jgi:hypothetical protein
MATKSLDVLGGAMRLLFEQTNKVVASNNSTEYYQRLNGNEWSQTQTPKTFRDCEASSHALQMTRS